MIFEVLRFIGMTAAYCAGILVIIFSSIAWRFGLVRTLNACFDHRVIPNCARQTYLLRWYIFRTKYVSLFLHKFVRSDEDRALHDHPWAFFVIPIWRGYFEHLVNPKYEALSGKQKFLAAGYGMATSRVKRVYPLISSRYRDTKYRHRVELLKDKEGAPLPAWSFFFHFTKVRDWGFWPADGFINWKDWWSSHKCE